MKCLIALLCLFASSATAFADTWVVDDDGGSGVDFTTISAALAVASDGDLVFIRAGDYVEDVSTSKGLIIRGQGGGTHLDGSFELNQLAANVQASLSGLLVESLLLNGCDGVVLLADLTVRGSSHTRIIDCADVRVHDSFFAPPFNAFSGPGKDAVRVSGSKVEFVGCRLWGARAPDTSASGFWGGTALIIESASTARLVATTCRGGEGGEGGGFSQPDAPGGAGGHGVLIRLGCDVVVSSTGSSPITGGYGGEPWGGGSYGADGAGIHNDGHLRISGTPGYTVSSLTGAGVLEQPVPADRFMELSGALTAGSQMQLTVHGEPGEVAYLLAGAASSAGIWPTSAGTLLVQPRRTIRLGVIPGDGRLTFDFDLPQHLIAGGGLVLQARVAGAVEDHLTNSVPLLVR